MKVLVLGVDGYLGFPLAIRLCDLGHDVIGVDNLLRRSLVYQIGGRSVTPIYTPKERASAVNNYFSGSYKFIRGDITNYEFLKNLIKEEDPDAIVNLAQIPSAPFSMKDPESCWLTIENNVKGNLNLLWVLKEHDRVIPVVQIATLGEYQITRWEIPDGFIEVEHNGVREKIAFPKDPLSYYHCSKVHMTINTMLACKIWDLKFTEIYQGVVYGVSLYEYIDEKLFTRFDIDHCFGTIINRFTAQAVIGHPLTVYGKGGQKRGFLSIKDSIHAITLAIKKPPKENYRAINQFVETYRVRELAQLVAKVAEEEGYKVEIQHILNPRIERENDHYYEPRDDTLRSLGFKPQTTIEKEIRETIHIVAEYKDRIKKELIMPTIRWK
ncbi:MAG TPA: NAD-dependent epimerase/dehydratase family protein [Archaeoglobus sp.]|nr:NAD-dependent epimerase/dehydratase family protein [Archaeoglobus sp.]